MQEVLSSPTRTLEAREPTVMVIDDSEADLLFTRIMLERTCSRWRLLSFESAGDALRHLSRGDVEPVDLILLDINMPGMNGFEFLQAYRALGAKRAPAAVVMLTSSSDPADRAHALSFPSVRGYVLKPLDAGAARGLVRYLS